MSQKIFKRGKIFWNCHNIKQWEFLNIFNFFSWFMTQKFPLKTTKYSTEGVLSCFRWSDDLLIQLIVQPEARQNYLMINLKKNSWNMITYLRKHTHTDAQ